MTLVQKGWSHHY